jgi:tetratricopeptide (TPR) repeat protein
MRSDRIQRRIDALLDEADQAVTRSDWALVRDRAQNVLALDPENADALAFLTAAERAMGGTAASPPPRPGPDAAATGAHAVRDEQPTSFASGRYEVKYFLGEGGKKKVYLAHDTLLDRDVAFALIKTEGLDEVGRERVRREAQAMGRLGAHPHIVSVFDLGEHEGQPYMVTELMGGGDVEGLLEKAEGHPLPLEHALRIADQVCQGLEFAHQQHLVHRDLKPGNVWLTAEGVAKIGDFGLAVATDRSRLTQMRLMVGTALYMPPEQAMGGEVSPQSDLYSLGAMLYELVTGRPPFVGDESVAIITQHLNTPPVSPSWHRPDLPLPLEALILQLLEKDPGKRPPSAGTVRQALGSIDLGTVPSRPAPGASSSAGETENPLYRRVFVGREGELRQVQAAFDAALGGHSRLMAVVGEPGIGKTALCEQLATYVAMRGGRTLVGHAYEEGSLSLPYLPFVEAMRAYVLARPPDALKEELGSGAPEVARIVSEVRERVGIEPPPGGLDPEEERWRLFQSVSGFLRTASTVQPLLIVLEDLHWADRGTLDLLTHLGRNLEGARLLVIATYRDVEVDRTHPLSAALAELRRISVFERVLLRGLSVDAVQRMLEAITGQEMRWAFAEAVQRQTEGNPLFVQEVIRYLAEEGLVTREGGRWQRTTNEPLEMSIPEGLRDVIGKRLSRLSAECNRVLSVAAVIGRDFGLRTLELLDAAPSGEELLSALEEAVHVGVIEDQSRGGIVRFRFTHAFFRQTLYEEIFTPRRLRLHQEVARALEQQYAARLDEHAAELAEHFAQSSDPADLTKAVHYAELAAQRSMAVFAYGEAVHHLEQALLAQEVLDPDDRAKRCDLLLALGAAQMPIGNPRRVADTIAPEAFALADRLGDRARAFRACHQALEALHRDTPRNTLTADWREWAARADRAASPGTAQRAHADVALARAAIASGDWTRGIDLLERGLALARQLDDPELLFTCVWQAIRNEHTPQHWRRTAVLAQEFIDWPRDGLTSRTLGQFLEMASHGLLAQGDRAATERVFAELNELASRTHDAFIQINALSYQGMRLILDGQLEEAVATAERMIAFGEETGTARVAAGFAQVRCGRALVHLGRLAEAAAWNTIAPMQGLMTDLLLTHAGQREETRRILDEWLAAHRDTTKALPIDYFNTFLSLFEVALDFEDREAMTLLSKILADSPPFVGSGSVICPDRFLGAAAAMLGDRTAAAAHYQRALEAAEQLRVRPEIALTRLQIAELLLDGSADEQQAAEHLDFAIEEFRAMKMQPSLERALSHKGFAQSVDISLGHHSAIIRAAGLESTLSNCGRSAIRLEERAWRSCGSPSWSRRSRWLRTWAWASQWSMPCGRACSL